MLAPEIQKYIDDHSNIEDAVLHEVDRNTHLHTLMPQMLSGSMQGKMLTLMTSLIDAKNVLEIGTFTGFGTICLARGVNSTEGKVVTIDVNPEFTFLVKKHLKLAGIEDRVETMIGDALKIIPERKEIWDLVYIDANKQEYVEYFNVVIDRVRPGGLILTDNVLWSGKVVNEPNEVDAKVINTYNRMLYDDPRIEVIILPVRDGLSVARKK
ncbi:MAG: O-methyltransferase [Saprospiraceae bacterium]|uniref:O-methyltransferase n=1 Tax=Candidatus Opimibacter skivensis TaxID=2982028 RepID=A0A9D7SR13_9BACT|nr:O-methyltransferase [Candidatus Opimibacter skivensis]